MKHARLLLGLWLAFTIFQIVTGGWSVVIAVGGVLVGLHLGDVLDRWGGR